MQLVDWLRSVGLGQAGKEIGSNRGIATRKGHEDRFQAPSFWPGVEPLKRAGENGAGLVGLSSREMPAATKPVVPGSDSRRNRLSMRQRRQRWSGRRCR